VAALAQQLSQQAVDQLQGALQLAACPSYRFDSAQDLAPAEGRPGVQKTRTRRVVSWNYGPFQAREVVRAKAAEAGSSVRRSSALAALVPRGGAYAFDLIVHVGLQTFLHGHTLAQVQAQQLAHHGGLKVPVSSLYELKLKFLFYLGRLHQQAAPDLQAYLTQRGSISWLIDGTLEPGTPVFFGVKEAQEDWLLDCWKLATENVQDVTACLKLAATRYGQPGQVRHDLSQRLARACEAALPKAAHFVCHYHLASDVGQDLYQAAQAALTQRGLALRLQGRLKEQRRSQTEWFGTHPERPLILAALLRGQAPEHPLSPTLGREILLAMHSWILDYASDGQRQGFPFDPHLLYYHRRLVQVLRGLDTLWQRPGQVAQAPAALGNLRQLLNDYLADPQVTRHLRCFEQAHRLFERFRSALRLAAPGSSPLRDAYALDPTAQQQVVADLEQLRQDLRPVAASSASPEEQKLRTILLTHLDKYWAYLGLALPPQESAANPTPRTTNALETHWTKSKRTCRQIHGRSKLTRDFQALPAEFMLLPNLRNPRYQQLVLGGDWAQLPNKFAQVPVPAGSFKQWRNQKRPEHCGRLPRSLIREDHFMDNLIGLCPDETSANGN